MGLLPDRQNCGLRMRRECRERFPRHRLQKKPLVSDPGIHHGTYVTHAHVGIAITCRGGEYIPGIPGVCATLNFVYLVRRPCMEVWCNVSRTHPRHGDLPFRYVTLSHVTNNKNSWAPFPFILHYWARCRLKSPASRLFTQPFIQTQIKENIKAPPHWPLCGEFTGDRWIPRTNGQWRGKCFHLMTSSC